MKIAFETRMLFKGVPFIVTLDEDSERTPRVKVAPKIARPYRTTESNNSLMIDLYLLLVVHADKFGEVFGWNTVPEAKQRIAKAVYEGKPEGLCWKGSWYSVEISAQAGGLTVK